MRVSLTQACPACSSDHLQRVHRKWWMRIFPGSRRYHCTNCSSYVLVIFGAYAIGRHAF